MELSGIARSTYYYYLNQKDVDKYSDLKQEIVEVFNQHKGRYGYRRILTVLKSKGYTINHKTVQKLMNTLGLKGKQGKNGKYHSYKGEVGKVADNILKRDFYAAKPFEKLKTDVTEFKVWDDKVYLSPVMDLYNREIVSYSISLSPNFWQIREMLDVLFDKLPDDARPIFHSDQGWQYQHAEYQRLLQEHNIVQSMSRIGNTFSPSSCATHESVLILRPVITTAQPFWDNFFAIAYPIPLLAPVTNAFFIFLSSKKFIIFI